MQPTSNNKGCSFVRTSLFAYFENTMPPEERREFETHLLSCPECSAIFNELRLFPSVIAEKKAAEPNPFAATRILQALEREHEKYDRHALPGFIRLARPAVFALFLGLAVFLGVLLGKLGTHNFTGQLNENDELQYIKSDLNLGAITDENNTFIMDYQP
jgi:anti-sigma factor RsiW